MAAGTLGAGGAFCVLLAFGAGGHPSYVMSIVFAGAPIVNAVVALLMQPPPGGYFTLRWQFVLGIFLGAAGGYLVAYYKPAPARAAPASASSDAEQPASAVPGTPAD